MFLIVYAINSPLDEQLSHNLSILGTLVYVFFMLCIISMKLYFARLHLMFLLLVHSSQKPFSQISGVNNV